MASIKLVLMGILIALGGDYLDNEVVVASPCDSVLFFDLRIENPASRIEELSQSFFKRVHFLRIDSLTRYVTDQGLFVSPITVAMDTDCFSTSLRSISDFNQFVSNHPVSVSSTNAWLYGKWCIALLYPEVYDRSEFITNVSDFIRLQKRMVGRTVGNPKDEPTWPRESERIDSLLRPLFHKNAVTPVSDTGSEVLLVTWDRISGDLKQWTLTVDNMGQIRLSQRLISSDVGYWTLW
jgi:hypothetical protein